MNIAIITGGESGEREVSIKSAKNIANIVSFGSVKTFVFPEDREMLAKEKDHFTIAIPMIHGAGGEDGSLQRFLEDQNIPYLYSPPSVHEICIDKRRTKQKAVELGITVAAEIDPSNLKFPLFAKPNSGGSSIASKFCLTEEALEELINANSHTDFLLEEPIDGREFTVGVVDMGTRSMSLPVIEIIPKTQFFDYESKYNEALLAEEICPAMINPTLSKQLSDAALAMHNALGAKHISRSDFLMDPSGKIYFLELNTIPGMTKTSLIPKMIKTAGLDIKELFQNWIDEILK
jgi:D-alanine-D-alanine ligase